MNLLELFNLEERFSIDEIESRLDIFRNYQQYIYACITLIVVINLILVSLMPSIQTYRKESKTLRQYSNVLKIKQKQALDKESIQKELDRLSSVLEEKKHVFFNTSEVEEFKISGLHKVAERTSIQIEKLALEKPFSGKQNVLIHPVNLNFNTDFKTLMQFFYLLEDHKKVVKINTFDIRRTSVNPVLLKVSLSVSLYMLRGS